MARLPVLYDVNEQPFEPFPKAAILLESGTSTKYLVVCGFLFIGITATGSYLAAAIVDVTNETLEWIIHPYTSPAVGESGAWSVAFGPVSDGAATIFWTEAFSGYEQIVCTATITATGFTSRILYTEPDAAKSPAGVAYNQLDNTVVIYREDGSFLKMNSRGSIGSTVSGAITGFNINVGNTDSFDGLITLSRPGYAIASLGPTWGDIYEIDLTDCTSSLVIDHDTLTDFDIFKYYNAYLGIMTEGSEDDGRIYKVTLGDATPGQVDLADIFLGLTTFNGRHTAGDLAFTDFLGNECYGVKYDTDTSIQDAKRTLREPFDVSIVESDGKLKFRFPRRDGAYTIDKALAANDFVDKGERTIEKVTSLEEEALVECTISFFDVDNYGEKSEVTFTRPVGHFEVIKSINRRTFTLPVYMTVSQALTLAAQVVYRSAYDLERYNATLAPSAAFVEPGDIVSFSFGGVTVVGQIKEAQLNADYTQDVVIHQYLQANDATYTGSSIVAPAIPTATLDTRFIYLDLPLLSDLDDLGGADLRQYALMASYGTGSVTGALYRSDGVEDYASVGSASQISPVVGTITALSSPPADPFETDTVGEITVFISSGDIDDLETITQEQFENGVNLAAIGRSGRWVLLLFQTVSTSGSFATLSDLLWGSRGSEVWLSSLAVGDTFVLLRSDEYTRFKNPLANLNDTFYYKAVNTLASIDDVIANAYAATGVAETPYASRNLAAEFAGADIHFTWDYRSRLASGLNPEDHGEATLEFEVDIMDGGSPSPGNVVRTITVSTNEATWTEAQYTADFGSLPTSWVWRVYMMSAVVGRGYRAEQISTVVEGAILLEGDEQSGTDQLLLEGDEQSGTDAESFREIVNG